MVQIVFLASFYEWQKPSCWFYSGKTPVWTLVSHYSRRSIFYSTRVWKLCTFLFPYLNYKMTVTLPPFIYRCGFLICFWSKEMFILFLRIQYFLKYLSLYSELKMYFLKHELTMPKKLKVLYVFNKYCSQSHIWQYICVIYIHCVFVKILFSRIHSFF